MSNCETFGFKKFCGEYVNTSLIQRAWVTETLSETKPHRGQWLIKLVYTGEVVLSYGGYMSKEEATKDLENLLGLTIN